MTYLWQEYRGSNYYRIQTDEKEVADKLKRRNGFSTAATVLNSNFWIFSAQFKRPDIAKKTIKSVTGRNPKIDSEGIIYYE